MKRIARKIIFGLVLSIVLTDASGFTGSTVAVQAKSKTQTEKKRALAAYKKFLSKKTIKWNKKSIKVITVKKKKKTVNETMKKNRKSYKFYLAYVEKGKAPLLVLVANGKGFDHSTGQVNIYSYKNGKMKFLLVADTFSYFKKKGVIGLPSSRSEDMEYYEVKNGKIAGSAMKPTGTEIFGKGYKITKANLKKYVR